MPGVLVTGAHSSNSDQTDQLIQVEDGVKFLNAADNGIKFIKKLLSNRGDKVAKHWKYQWDETALPVRRETMTFASGVDTTPTVASSKAYHIGDILRCENELVRVTGLPSATTLTVTRSYGGTTGVAHTAKIAFNLGYYAAENSTGPAAITTGSTRLYNLVSQIEEAVEFTEVDIATLTTYGNPLTRNVELMMLSYWKRFANAVVKGIRFDDTTNNIRTFGGVDFFVTTNVQNVAGALTIAVLDGQILNIVNGGGNPDTIVVNPYQKQKLDALDANKQLLGKREHTGGNLVTNTWQSGILDHELEVIIDHTLANDELYVFDSTTMAIIPLINNGVDGRLSVVDATLPGQSGKKKVLRGYYTFELLKEAANAKLYGLT